MRRLFFSAVLCGLVSLAFGQNLTITGKVSCYKQCDTLYYATNGGKFTTKSFVLIGKDSVYNISVPLKTIQNDSIETITFTLYITAAEKYPKSCTQTINIAKALQIGKLDKKNPSLISDMLANCLASLGGGWIDYPANQFIGAYDVDNKIVILKDTYGSVIQYQTISDNLTTEETGGWHYNASKNQITLSIYQQVNPEIGIIISKRKEYVFDVINENGTIKLELSR